MGDEDDAAGPMWDSETPAGCWWARNKMVRGLYLAASTVAFDFVFVVPDTTFVGVATLVDTVKAVEGEQEKEKGEGHGGVVPKMQEPRVFGKPHQIDECLLMQPCVPGAKLTYADGASGVLFNRAAVRIAASAEFQDVIPEETFSSLVESYQGHGHLPGLREDSGVPIALTHSFNVRF